MEEEKKPTPRIVGADLDAKADDAAFANRPPAAAPTPLVEDASVVGGTDEWGRPVIAPKRADGTVSEDVNPTDPREKSE